MRGIVLALVLGLLISGCTLLGGPEQCGSERAYVCGSDGNTYTNACYARQANVSVAYEGMCAQQNTTNTQCVDSDNGKNALEAGYITKGETRQNDSCASTTAVFEYYCTDNEIQSERVSCPEGTECSGGMCASPVCMDSDGGQAADVLGTTARGTERYTDDCSDANTVKEYYCSESGIANILLACGSGRACVDGACAAVACTDSDGGMNILERGTLREGGGVYVDYCSGTSSVKEYYCSGGTMVQTVANCGEEFYCSDGRCLEYTCRDTDSGRDEDEYGTVSKGSDEWEDDCYDSDTVKEYYCDGNTISDTRINCGSSEMCSGGECIRETCTDTDGGNVRGIFGTTTAGASSSPDACADLYTLKEYFCSGSSVAEATVNCFSAYHEYCYSNVCSPVHCEDSDGGEDEHTYGTVRVYTDNGYSRLETDSCSGSYAVKERFCNREGEGSFTTIECASGEVCSSGRCIEDTCADSDGGRNYIVPGTTTKGTTTRTDSCDPMDSYDLYEYYCSGNEIQYEIRYCPDECVENASGVGYCNPL